MTKRKKNVIWLMIILTLFSLIFLYQIIFFGKGIISFIGFNFIFFIENLVDSPVNPIINWGVLGGVCGLLVGVIVATKKLRLSRKIVVIPVSFFVLFISLMIFINAPYSSYSINCIPDIDNTTHDANNQMVKPPVYGYVGSSNGANVRVNPNTNCNVILKVPYDTRVEILDISDDSSWVKVKINYDSKEYNGYIYHKIIKTE